MSSCDIAVTDRFIQTFCGQFVVKAFFYQFRNWAWLWFYPGRLAELSAMNVQFLDTCYHVRLNIWHIHAVAISGGSWNLYTCKFLAWACNSNKWVLRIPKRLCWGASHMLYIDTRKLRDIKMVMVWGYLILRFFILPNCAAVGRVTKLRFMHVCDIWEVN